MNTAQQKTSSDADALATLTTDLHSSIYVEAGAGTGKTYSLVQRITALLKAGVQIDQIIAITFTRAAASELRSRIRGELEELYAKDPSNEDISEALKGIDTAAFQTIDSLVHSILQEYPLEARLPPAIDFQDRFSEFQVFRERWRQWSTEQLSEDGAFAEALSTALRLGLRSPFEEVLELAKLINARHSELRNARFNPPPRIAVKTFEYLKNQIDRIKITMSSCSNSEDKLHAKFQQVIDWYCDAIQGQSVKSENDAEEVLITWIGVKSGNSGTAGNWGGKDGKADAIAVLDEFVEAIQNALAAAREDVTVKLFHYANQFVNTILEERRRAGRVSHYDAITWLVDMLESRDDIRRSIQKRYRRVLVDEFQDTDPNQVRLVRLLTIPPGENKVAPGSLFIVGDPKQSIYRFRGAKVDVSQTVKDDVTKSGGQYLTLKENRRSTRPIIDWVNHVFGRWMQSEEDQADWIPLDRARETATSDEFGKVRSFGEPITDANVHEVRMNDAKEVATIASAICAGALKVRDRQTNDRRPSHAGDLTILTNSRSNWDTYTGELDKLDLPYSAEIRGAAVLRAQEFRDILNCLAAMDDPSDQPATVGALKSIFFGCTDRDLFMWANAGGKFSCTAEPPSTKTSTRVDDAMEVLRHYNALRDKIPPPVLVERFIRERQARELMYLENDPVIGLRRLDLAVELTRKFTEAGAASLRECLKIFVQYRESGEDIREEPSLQFDQGKIRLMTIHASKGLEFPIVILADLCGSRTSRKPKLLTNLATGVTDDVKIGVRIGGRSGEYFQAGEYEELLKRDTVAEALEKTRLLYVAATRTRDYLFVSRNQNAKEPKCYATNIDKHVDPDNSALWEPFVLKHPTRESAPSAPETAIAAPPAQDRASWRREHYRAIDYASMRSWISPVSIKETMGESHFSNADEKPDDTPISDSDEPSSRGRAATSIGSAVHAAVQRCIETPNYNLDQIARYEADKHAVSQHADEIARLTYATLSTPLLRRVMKTHLDDIWIETPVAAPIPTSNESTIVIEGRADLIYRLSDGTLGIADFKTDRTFDRSIHDMAEPYIPQLGAYAYAVQETTGIPVTEASIIFSRIAADNQDEGEYRILDIQSAIELSLKLASKLIAQQSSEKIQTWTS